MIGFKIHNNEVNKVIKDSQQIKQIDSQQIKQIESQECCQVRTDDRKVISNIEQGISNYEVSDVRCGFYLRVYVFKTYSN